MLDRKVTPKPAFNVTEPFMGVWMVQLNREMCELLRSFIAGVSDVVEEELISLRSTLESLDVDSSYYSDGSSYHFSKEFANTYILRLNTQMRNLLIDFVADIEGGVEKIVWAFHLALRNPEGPRESKKRYFYNDKPFGPQRHSRFVYGGDNYRR